MSGYYQKALKKGINEEYIRKLCEPSDFLDKMFKITHTTAVASGLIQCSPIIVSDLLQARKAISIFIMHSEYIKEKYGETDESYTSAQFSAALYAGFLCALKWWEETGDGEEILYNDCVIDSYSSDKADIMLCEKYCEDKFVTFLEDVVYIVADEIGKDNVDNFEKNMIFSFEALFQIGVTLALYEK
ncbi:MAG: hypothetical protein K6G15_06670 [Desulfovibrio sp.]|nr:hypothetical protein [Desulfovibrio sp.]